MCRALCHVVPLLAVLVSFRAGAQASEAPPPLLVARRVVIPEVTSSQPLEVRVSPDFLTTLELDASVDPEAVTVEGHEAGRLALFEVSTRSVVLRLAVALEAGEKLLLTVPFADGRVPGRATFALVRAEGEVDAQLQVVRHGRSPEALEAELATCQARGESAQRAFTSVVRLLAAGAQPQSLRGNAVPLGVNADRFILYRSPQDAVILVHLSLTEGSPPWTLGVVTLLDPSGHVVTQLSASLDGEGPLQPGEQRLLAVRLPPPLSDEATFDVEVREQGGLRGVRLHEIGFKRTR